MRPRRCHRNPALEEAVGSTDAQLVYADWLEEHGEPIAAEGYRWLAGAGEQTASAVGRALGLVCVAHAVCAFSAVARATLRQRDLGIAEHNALNNVIVAVHDQFDALSRATKGQAPAPEPRAISLPSALPPGWPPTAQWDALLRALSRFRDALSDERDGGVALGDALKACREPTHAAERLATWALWSWAASGRSLLESDAAMAQRLSEDFEEDDVSCTLPLAGKTLGFSFAKVLITNATQGIHGVLWMTEPNVSPRAALVSMAAAEGFSATNFNALSVEDRLEWLNDEMVDGETQWQPMSHFDAMEWLHLNLEHNEGEGIRVDGGPPTTLMQALEPLGAYRSGAVSQGDFPCTLLELEHGWLYSRLFY